MAPSVLIVDDDERLRELLALKLQQRFAVETRPHGGAAMEYLEATADAPPDAVILDVMMPGMDGFQFLDWITTDERFEDVVVIMLTARGNEDDAVKALESGATDFLTKPVAANELIARIDHALG